MSQVQPALFVGTATADGVLTSDQGCYTTPGLLIRRFDVARADGKQRILTGEATRDPSGPTSSNVRAIHSVATGRILLTCTRDQGTARPSLSSCPCPLAAIATQLLLARTYPQRDVGSPLGHFSTPLILSRLLLPRLGCLFTSLIPTCAYCSAASHFSTPLILSRLLLPRLGCLFTSLIPTCAYCSAASHFSTPLILSRLLLPRLGSLSTPFIRSPGVSPP